MNILLKRVLLILGFTVLWVFAFIPVSELRDSFYGESSFQGFSILGNVMLAIYILGIIVILRKTKTTKKILKDNNISKG